MRPVEHTATSPAEMSSADGDVLGGAVGVGEALGAGAGVGAAGVEDDGVHPAVGATCRVQVTGAAARGWW